LLPVVGTHNVLNALAAMAASAMVGVDPQTAMQSMASFKGVARRQEIVGEVAGITIVDDFAHHPTAARVTCEGIKKRYADRRLVAVFEPRTNTSRRAVFQAQYGASFSAADVVVLSEPRNVDTIPAADRFSSARLAHDLAAKGKEAASFADTDGILEFLGTKLDDGDVVLVMSNGNFDNLAGRLAGILKERTK
jgi:UDP-N-acetylmuramate: L-alanyl-gamma-D-glutamyl-meso-diaminopimelate ligase